MPLPWTSHAWRIPWATTTWRPSPVRSKTTTALHPRCGVSSTESSPGLLPTRDASNIDQTTLLYPKPDCRVRPLLVDTGPTVYPRNTFSRCHLNNPPSGINRSGNTSRSPQSPPALIEQTNQFEPSIDRLPSP